MEQYMMADWNIDLLTEDKTWISDMIWSQDGTLVTKEQMNLDDEYIIL